MLLMDIHRAGAHGQQIYGGGGKFVKMGEMELFMMLVLARLQSPRDAATSAPRRMQSGGVPILHAAMEPICQVPQWDGCWGATTTTVELRRWSPGDPHGHGARGQGLCSEGVEEPRVRGPQEAGAEQEMYWRKRGRRRVASNQELEKTSENKKKLIKRLNMTTLGHGTWPEESHTYLQSSLLEEVVQVQVLAAEILDAEDSDQVLAAEVLDAENSDQVLAAEDSPKYTPVDEASKFKS
jgi:hypothetical protein